MREAQARVNSAEFTEERAFDLIYPTAEERIDRAAAWICCMLSHSDCTPADFLPEYLNRVRDPEEVSEERIADQVNAFFAGAAGKGTTETRRHGENPTH